MLSCQKRGCSLYWDFNVGVLVEFLKARELLTLGVLESNCMICPSFVECKMLLVLF